VTAKTSDSAAATLEKKVAPKKETPLEPKKNVETPQPAAETPAPAPEAAAEPATITVDDSAIIACYANFCRVSSTPEELVLDLGLNPQPMSGASTTVQVSQRVILNHFTAKRLLGALSAALQRHELAFGVLETDVRKRVQAR
jgi:hypothetical protein